MRRTITVALTSLFVLGGAASAQVEKPVRSIAVSGTVHTKTAPDHNPP